VRESSWRGIVDGMTGGYLDAAQMPSGMPMWLTLGGHNNQPFPVVTALTMTRNGNAITLAKRFYDQGVQSLSDFKTYLLDTHDQRHTMGVVHPASMHNLLLRYWLAAGGIDPDSDVDMKTIPPAQMVADLQAGSIDGYCVGEPWNYRAAAENVGFTIATDLEVWLGHPGKVLGVREEWAEAYPNSHIALTKALLEACQYCANPDNAQEIRQILASRDYVSTDLEYIQLEDPDSLTCDINHPLRDYAHHQFYSESAINRPSRTEQIWIMTQLARWGDTPFPRNWVEVVERVCRVRVFSTAARELGLDISYIRQPIKLFDGTPFNADDPIAYLNNLKIKRDFSVAEVILDAPRRKLAS